MNAPREQTSEPVTSFGSKTAKPNSGQASINQAIAVACAENPVRNKLYLRLLPSLHVVCPAWFIDLLSNMDSKVPHTSRDFIHNSSKSWVKKMVYGIIFHSR